MRSSPRQEMKAVRSEEKKKQPSVQRKCVFCHEKREVGKEPYHTQKKGSRAGLQVDLPQISYRRKKEKMSLVRKFKKTAEGKENIHEALVGGGGLLPRSHVLEERRQLQKKKKGTTRGKMGRKEGGLRLPAEKGTPAGEKLRKEGIPPPRKLVP